MPLSFMLPTGQIAKNTILLFVRMSVLMLISILAVRFVRSGLGVEEYGVFTAVNGLVQLVICLNTVLASASQRFFSVAMGESDTLKLHDSFRASVRLSWRLCAVVFVLFETLGLWFVCCKMQYPPERLVAVLIAYQLSLLTFLSALLQVPYLAAIMAHERMDAYACISILDAVLRLSCALAIFVCPLDKLVFYTAGLALVSLLSTSLYILYARHQFAECRQAISAPLTDRSIYGRMLDFSGWTLFGALAGVAMLQGNLLLLNVYHGPVVNAAFAVSLQVFSAFIALGNNVIFAVRPQMVMAYSDGRYDRLNYLFIRSSQAVWALCCLVAVPLILAMPWVLRLWLGDSDVLTVHFCQLMIVNVLVQVLGNQFTIVMQAAGRVREYHLLVESITLLSLPLSILALSLGARPEWVVLISIVVFIFAHAVRMERVCRYYPAFPLRDYCRRVLLPIVAVGILLLGTCLLLR